MKRLDKMHSILSQALRPIKIKIIDDSDLHVGHAEASGVGETHFRIEIISEEFTNKTRIDRERLIHGLLADEFSAGLHSISIKASSPSDI
ncbi:MAG: BolA family transcriptional regulator [Alphaproteobacteria bacterium]|nr:BolA family transcriptional regulator [Alphaproteobacteria bacterium]